MLRDVKDLLCDDSLEINSNEIFNRFEMLANEFTTYLAESESLTLKDFYTEQKNFVESQFYKLSNRNQLEKFNRFKKHYSLCRDLTKHGIKLTDKKELLARFMWKNRLKMPDSQKVFDLIEENSYIEIYDDTFRQSYRSPNFLEITSHSLLALETCEVFQLFKKSKQTLDEQMYFVHKIYNREIKAAVFSPSSVHTVKEINSPKARSSQATPKAYVPIYDESDSFQGFLHLFDLIDTRFLNFELIK